MEPKATFKFARADQSQRAAIDRLMTAAFTPYVIKLGNGSTAGPYPWLEEAISKGDVYVGLAGTETIGVVTTTRQNNELEIGQLGVDPARQGEGIGIWLLEHIEEMARREQIEALTLQTAEMMTHLLRLYTRHGFQITRKALPEHGEDEYLRVHMIKRLE